MTDVESILNDANLEMYDCAACKIKHIDNGKHQLVTLPCCHAIVCKDSFVDHLDAIENFFKTSIACSQCKHKLPRYMIVNGKETRYFTKYQTITTNFLLGMLEFTSLSVLMFPFLFFVVGVYVVLNVFGICFSVVSSEPYCFSRFHYPITIPSSELFTTTHELFSVGYIPLIGVCIILLITISWMMHHKMSEQFYKIRRFSIHTMRERFGFYYSSML